MYSAGDFKREVVSTSSNNQSKAWRDDFGRDYGRIIHSASFRRLQGKTQVFPTNESDFFRNRLTHSLEVAQIAEGIAEQINHNNPGALGKPINGTLCATAGLVHDMGHPPFGHNGERALDKAMHLFGGFEGNAQTLRILTRLEKKAKYTGSNIVDERAGFGLCYRTLASALKYDKVIPPVRGNNSKLAKGYYYSERHIVERIKKAVLGASNIAEVDEFMTIECSIMDLADDVAFSVYDLEDCLKAEFVTPLGMLSTKGQIIDKVVEDLSEQFKREVRVDEVIAEFIKVFGFDKWMQQQGTSVNLASQQGLEALVILYSASQKVCTDAYQRTALSSSLVHEFITNVKLNVNKKFPQLSTVTLPDHLMLRREALKKYTYYAAVYSPRVKMGEFRGDDLVTDIFEALMGDKGHLLMPDDVRVMFEMARKKRDKARIVCDFVAGMTDRYAMEFWGRLNSDNPESIFKPI